MILQDKKISFRVLDNLEEIRSKWIETFIGDDINETELDGCLWCLSSYKAKTYLEDSEAKKAFDSLRKNKYYVFYDNYRYDDGDLEQYKNKVFEVDCKDKLKAKDLKKESDIYIVDKYFRWTYVNTHEVDYGMEALFYRV